MLRSLLAFLLACLTAASAAAAPAQPLLVYYRDKPPYSYTEKGRPAGFLMARTEEILRLAQFQARYTELPVRRILQEMQTDRSAICSPSWYRLPEREKFAQFSLPIHRDRPHVILAHADAVATVRAHRRIADLFADVSLSMGVVEGVSYGGELDRAITARSREPVRAVVSPLQVAKMVAARRADFMLIDQEDLGWLRQRPEFDRLGLARVDFADMPPGLTRHLMCSRQVTPQQMERLNQAIRQLLPELNPG